MPDDAECTPRRLAKEIEGCIVRNAMDEEERAQKALFLLKARDRRIAFLEKRVAVLENAAASIEINLQASSRLSILDRSKEDSSNRSQLTHSQSSLKTDDDATSNLSVSTRDRKMDEVRDTSSDQDVSVPQLSLSKSSMTNSDDIFTTPAVDLVLERKNYFNRLINGDKNDPQVAKKANKAPVGNAKSETILKSIKDNERTDAEKKMASGEGDFNVKEAIKLEKAVSERDLNENRIGGSVLNRDQRGFRIPRASSSVPRIRAKRSFRRKLRGFELRSGRRVGELSTFAPVRATGTGSSPTVRLGEGNQEVHDADEKTEGGPLEDRRVPVNVEGARLIAGQKIDTETKTTFTQTLSTVIEPKTSQITEEAVTINHSSPTSIYLKQKKSSTFWSVDEDPAPQWLIAEALSAVNRATEHSERRTKVEASSSKETERQYASMISELEQKLSRTKMDLDEALKKKLIAKEKYKRTLEDVKSEARKENEMLQERIVRICTSVLENFGPRMAEKRGSSYQLKCRKRLRYHENLFSKLRKKLRVIVTRSNKLRRELTKTRAALKSKTEKCESIHKCFEKLQQEMDTSEANLNKLISENLELRKRIEDTREWVQNNISKENHEKSNAVHYRDMQRGREVANLKKKADEDFTMITQLRSKCVHTLIEHRSNLEDLQLIRAESTNANKGFLLNSYKSQLADLNKEKNQLLLKVKNLENEIAAVKSNNSQLKAKISILNNEKDKLLSHNEKSKVDIEKSETQTSKKFEEAVQQKVENMRANYEETIKSMTTKLSAAKNQNVEYLKSVKDFLKRLCDSQNDYEKQSNPKKDEPSEKEAQKTACDILNMTPEELSGFINGKTPNSVNTWTLELNRIVTKSNFSENLSKFLLKKATRRLKS